MKGIQYYHPCVNTVCTRMLSICNTVRVRLLINRSQQLLQYFRISQKQKYRSYLSMFTYIYKCNTVHVLGEDYSIFIYIPSYLASIVFVRTCKGHISCLSFLNSSLQFSSLRVLKVRQ